jgi:hypothetical protein
MMKAVKRPENSAMFDTVIPIIKKRIDEIEENNLHQQWKAHD